MTDDYIHLGDFEKYVRNRFKNIVGGEGLVIPRIAVKIALDDIFKPDDASQPQVEADALNRCVCDKCGQPHNLKLISGSPGQGRTAYIILFFLMILAWLYDYHGFWHIVAASVFISYCLLNRHTH